MKKKIFIASLLLFSFACEKEPIITPPDDVIPEELTEQTWRVCNFFITTQDSVIDASSLFFNQLDDTFFYSFNDNGLLYHRYINETDFTYFRYWKFSNNYSNINIAYDKNFLVYNQIYDVVKLSNDTLKLFLITDTIENTGSIFYFYSVKKEIYEK